MYLFIITFGLCFSYFFLHYFLPIFFEKEIEKINKKAYIYISIVAILSLLIYVIVLNIPNIELGNRLLHSIGGGFMAFLVCFLVVRDGQLKVSKLQFFVFSVLFVTAMGVTNEIAEFVMHNYMGLVMATSINDTWLDLISNLGGTLVAGLLFVPFINTKNQIDQASL